MQQKEGEEEPIGRPLKKKKEDKEKRLPAAAGGGGRLA